MNSNQEILQVEEENQDVFIQPTDRRTDQYCMVFRVAYRDLVKRFTATCECSEDGDGSKDATKYSLPDRIMEK